MHNLKVFPLLRIKQAECKKSQSQQPIRQLPLKLRNFVTANARLNRVDFSLSRFDSQDSRPSVPKMPAANANSDLPNVRRHALMINLTTSRAWGVVFFGANWLRHCHRCRTDVVRC
jgi:hypothetical protein